MPNKVKIQGLLAIVTAIKLSIYVDLIFSYSAVYIDSQHAAD